MLTRDIRLQYIGDIWDVKLLHQMLLALIYPKIVFILVILLPGKIQKKKVVLQFEREHKKLTKKRDK